MRSPSCRFTLYIRPSADRRRDGGRFTSVALAQQPPTPTRVRGTIESVDGDLITVKSRSGEDVKLHMTSDMKVVGIVKIALTDIKLGSFIGTTTVPGPDGGRKRSRCTSFRRPCAAPARDRGPTI